MDKWKEFVLNVLNAIRLRNSRGSPNYNIINCVESQYKAKWCMCLNDEVGNWVEWSNGILSPSQIHFTYVVSLGMIEIPWVRHSAT